MSNTTSELVIPHDWTFRDAKVAAAFDRHVREQLPFYDWATGALAHFVRHYLPRGGVLYDFGASTGNLGRAVADVLKDRAAGLVAIEPSEEMREQYRGPEGIQILTPSEFERRRGLTLTDLDETAWQQLRPQAAEHVTFDPAPDVAVFFLTLSFVPVAARRVLLERIWKALRPGGVLLVFDKGNPPGGYLGQVVRRLTLAGKMATGAAPEAIVAKELSLGGVQRPVEERTLCALEGDDPDVPPSPPLSEWLRFGEFVGWAVER